MSTIVKLFITPPPISLTSLMDLLPLVSRDILGGPYPARGPYFGDPFLRVSRWDSESIRKRPGYFMDQSVRNSETDYEGIAN